MANSPLLQIPLLAPNQSNKETTINDGFSIIERSLNDIATVDLSSSDVTLNSTEYTRTFLFELSGHTVARELFVPNSTRLFGVYNDGTAIVTVSVDGESGLTADIPAGSFVVLFNNGVDIRKISDSAASGQVSAFLSLPDTPASFATHAGEAIVVNGTEDALEFGTITVSFTQLQDAPSSYSGQIGKTVKVNGAGDGLEFADYINSLTGLTDTPSSYTGQAGRMLLVATNETELEFQDVPEPIVVARRTFSIPNGGFEDGDLTNWIVPSTSGSVWTVDNGFGLISPSEGDFLAYHGDGQGDEPTVLAYDLDFLDVAYPDEIDGTGNTMIVEIAMGSPVADIGYIEIEFLDLSGGVLTTETSPQYEGTDTMIDRRFEAVIPTGARGATVYFYAINNLDGSDTDDVLFAFDDFRSELRLIVDQINEFTDLFDTPLGYDGEAGKMVVVNNTEDGLEFTTAPAVRDNFYDLLDTPINYTGSGGYHLRVTSGEDGIEFALSTILELNDTPSDYDGHSKEFLRVNVAENAVEFHEPALNDLSDVDLFTEAPTDGQILQFASSSGVWRPVDFEVPKLEINTQTDDYTLVLADDGKYVRMNKATALNLTVPTNASVAFELGTTIPIRQVGAGQLTVVAAGGVTINTPETLLLRKQGSGATLIKVATDEWDIVGDLELSA